MTILTQARLQELLDYDPLIGIFVRKVRTANCAAGSQAGSLRPTGYIQISIDNRLYRAHHLAWLWMTGKMPVNFIDHKNMNKNDNRWENLREATKSQNQMNTKLQSNNRSGAKGVTFYRPTQKWMAMIWKDRKAIFLGYYDTIEEAAAVRNAAAETIHGEFARAA